MCIFNSRTKTVLPFSSGRPRLWWPGRTSRWKRIQSESFCGWKRACAHTFVLICPPGKSQFFFCFRRVNLDLLDPLVLLERMERGYHRNILTICRVWWLHAEWHKPPLFRQQNFPFDLFFYASVVWFVHTFTCFKSTSAFLITSRCDLISLGSFLFLLLALLSSYSHMHLHCHTWTSLATHISPFSIIVHRLLLTLTRSLFFLPGRRWRDRTQGTSWWTSEWSRVQIQSSAGVQGLHGSNKLARSIAVRHIIYHVWFIIRYAEMSHYWDKRRTRGRH